MRNLRQRVARATHSCKDRRSHRTPDALRYQAISSAGAAEGAGAAPASFFAAWRAAVNFCHSSEARRQLACRILFLQRLQLAFQLPQRKRHVHFRRNEKRLDEKRPVATKNSTLADEQRSGVAAASVYPLGSEKTNGVTCSGGDPGMRCL